MWERSLNRRSKFNNNFEQAFRELEDGMIFRKNISRMANRYSITGLLAAWKVRQLCTWDLIIWHHGYQGKHWHVRLPCLQFRISTALVVSFGCGNQMTYESSVMTYKFKEENYQFLLFLAWGKKSRVGTIFRETNFITEWADKKLKTRKLTRNIQSSSSPPSKLNSTTPYGGLCLQGKMILVNSKLTFAREDEDTSDHISTWIRHQL